MRVSLPFGSTPLMHESACCLSWRCLRTCGQGAVPMWHNGGPCVRDIGGASTAPARLHVGQYLQRDWFDDDQISAEPSASTAC